MKLCKCCHDGEHANYDDDVRDTMVRDPDDGRIEIRAPLCGEHRTAYRDDGYTVTELTYQERRRIREGRFMAGCILSPTILNPAKYPV